MNRLLFGSYGANFDNYKLMHDIADATREFGAGIELAIFSKISRRPDHIFGMMREVIPFEDTYITLHGPYYEVEAASEAGSAENEYFFESYAEAFGIYRAYGAHSMVVHTNQFAFKESERSDMMKRSKATLLRLAKMAEAAGVNLLIENVGEPLHENVLYSQEDYVKLFDELPESVCALIDTGHAMVNRWNIFELIDALGSRIKGYHIHNNDGTRDQHLHVFREGLLYDREKMTKLLRYMEAKTPSADWILEYAPGPHITPNEIRSNMREIMACLKEDFGGNAL